MGTLQISLKKTWPTVGKETQESGKGNAVQCCQLLFATLVKLEQDYKMLGRKYGVSASGPTIWTNTYGLEPVLCNGLLVEPSGWAQTVHMFTQRFT